MNPERVELPIFGTDNLVIFTPAELELVKLARVCGWKPGLAVAHVRGLQFRFWRGPIGAIEEVHVPRKGLKRWVAREVRRFLRNLS